MGRSRAAADEETLFPHHEKVVDKGSQGLFPLTLTHGLSIQARSTLVPLLPMILEETFCCRASDSSLIKGLQPFDWSLDSLLAGHSEAASASATPLLGETQWTVSLQLLVLTRHKGMRWDDVPDASNRFNPIMAKEQQFCMFGHRLQPQSSKDPLRRKVLLWLCQSSYPNQPRSLSTHKKGPDVKRHLRDNADPPPSPPSQRAGRSTVRRSKQHLF